MIDHSKHNLTKQVVQEYNFQIFKKTSQIRKNKQVFIAQKTSEEMKPAEAFKHQASQGKQNVILKPITLVLTTPQTQFK